MQRWLDSLISLSSNASLDQKGSCNFISQPVPSYSCWWNKGFWFCASRFTPNHEEMHPAGPFWDSYTAPQTSLSTPPPAGSPVLLAAIPPVLCFPISDIFRSPGILKDGSLIFFHSPCCFAVVVSKTRSGECQVYTLLCTIWKFPVGVTFYYNQEYCHLTIFTSVFSLMYAVHMLGMY